MQSLQVFVQCLNGGYVLQGNPKHFRFGKAPDAMNVAHCSGDKQTLLP